MFPCADHICNSHPWANENITVFSINESSIVRNALEVLATGDKFFIVRKCFKLVEAFSCDVVNNSFFSVVS